MTNPLDETPATGSEDLVAYLDHEIDAATGEALERRLAEDAGLRKELSRFEQVWEALDSLPRSTVNDNFTHKTVELVAQAAENDFRATNARRALPRSRAWLWRVGLFALLLVVGFYAVRARFPNPNRKLIEALPIVENLDQYRAAGDVEFLRELERHGVFADPAIETAGAAATTEAAP